MKYMIPIKQENIQNQNEMRFSLFFVLIIFISCQEPSYKPTPAPKKLSDTSEKIITNDFEKFYVQFNKDSAFRQERTVFPLKGFNSTREIWTTLNYRFPHIDISKVDTTRDWYTLE